MFWIQLTFAIRRYAKYDAETGDLTRLEVPAKVAHGVEIICGRFDLDYTVVKDAIEQAHMLAKQPGGFTRAQTKLAQQNLLCLVSDLYMGSDDYQAEAAQVVAAKAGAQAGVGKAGVVGLQARAATAVAHLGAREDGPNDACRRWT